MQPVVAGHAGESGGHSMSDSSGLAEDSLEVTETALDLEVIF